MKSKLSPREVLNPAPTSSPANPGGNPDILKLVALLPHSQRLAYAHRAVARGTSTGAPPSDLGPSEVRAKALISMAILAGMPMPKKDLDVFQKSLAATAALPVSAGSPTTPGLDRILGQAYRWAAGLLQKRRAS